MVLSCAHCGTPRGWLRLSGARARQNYKPLGFTCAPRFQVLLATDCNKCDCAGNTPLLCVCVRVWVREKEREKEKGRGKEREKERKRESLRTCVYVRASITDITHMSHQRRRGMCMCVLAGVACACVRVRLTVANLYCVTVGPKKKCVADIIHWPGAVQQGVCAFLGGRCHSPV